MGTLAISSANLDTLENNILVLNDNINSVAGDIININGQINTVNSEVNNMKATVTSLEEEIRNFMAEIRGTTVVANAQNDILLKENDLSKKYGKHDTIRDNILGLISSINMNLVSKKTLKTETEKVLMVAPNYFLSYALIALSCWFNNDKNGAEKALNNALKLNNKKTSLLMGLVHSKLGRIGTSYKWIKRYLDSLALDKVDNDFIILLDAYSEGLLDNSINDLVKSKLNSLLAVNDNKEEVIDRFEKVFTLNKKSTSAYYPYISQFTDNASNLYEVYNNARDYFDAYFQLEDLINDSKVSNNKDLDVIIKNLIDSYEESELTLRQEVLKDKLIIKYNGDFSKVDSEFKGSKLAYSNNNDIYTVLTNILLERNDVSVSLKRLAVSSLKDVIKTGIDRALPTSNIGTTQISINNFVGITTSGENENELIKQMIEEVRLPYDSQIKNLFRFNYKLLICIIAFILGIVCAFTLSPFIGFSVALISVCFFIYIIFNLLDKKASLEKDYESAVQKYKLTLENVLAEIVDINFSVKRASDNYNYIMDYLDSFEVR